MKSNNTKLEYYDDMWKLHSTATVLSFSKGDDNSSGNKRHVLMLDSTIFHPQGGGQPSDNGFIFSDEDPTFNFIVHDVRSNHGVVCHYGVVEGSESAISEGKHVLLSVDESRRKLNSRLHSAGHLLDACLQNVGLGYLEPGKGYHFPDGPFVEYKGTVPQNELKSKQKELELEANALISKGGRISASILSYEEACKLCGGSLPDYISKDSNPRIVKLGDNPGCPCGGTHVYNISEIGNLQVTQLRTKKGTTKVFYTVGS